jgi:NADPH2:quinone reductase
VRAAILDAFGETPRYGEFDAPRPAAGHIVVEVVAAAIHHLDLHKATGTFYMGPPPLPSIVGSDGIGRRPDGRRVYFDASAAPYGSLAEQTLVPEDSLFDVAEDVDDATAAALGNTGLAAWLAVAWRSGLQAGETVLVLGATGACGSVAVQAAKLLGAGRVVAAARPSERLERLLDRGADAVVELDVHDDLPGALRDAAGGEVQVTVDTLWGEPALAAMQVAARFGRHVEVGNLAGIEIDLKAPAIRSVSLDLRGFSVAHPPLEIRREGFLRLTEHAARGDVVVDLERYPLEDVQTAWDAQREATGGVKRVLLPGAA